MKRLHPDLLTLLLAHVAGSYCGYIPALLTRLMAPELHQRGGWIYVCLAPVCTPIYLALMTVADFPHYHSYVPQTWACYTIAFLIVCLIRHRKTPVLRLVIAPVFMTLFVTALEFPGGAADPWRSPLEGKPAPEFTLTSLVGTTCTMSREKGHVVLIDFWATSCPPCRAELQQTIAKLAQDASMRERGLRVWTIDVTDNADTARKFMNENHYDFNVMLDSQHVAGNLYPGYGIPTTYLVARDGLIRKAFSGFDSETDKQLRGEIDAALK